MARYDAGSGLSGAVSGASIGSFGGPLGIAAGAGIGGLLGLFGSKKKKPKKKSTFDPLQRKLYEDKIASLRGQGPFNDLYNFNGEKANQVFDQNVARPEYRNFQENIVPQITGQFRGNNLQNSSYLGQNLSRAGRDVEETLAAQRAAMQFQGEQQAQQNRLSGIDNVLNASTFVRPTPQQSAGSPIDQILGSLAPRASNWLGDYLSELGSPKKSATAPSVAGASARLGGGISGARSLFGPRIPGIR